MNKTTFEVTDVFIYPARSKNGSPIRAYASIIISRIMRIYGIKVLEGDAGLYISWPKYNIDGRDYKPVLVLDAEARSGINGQILNKYKKGDYTVKPKVGDEQ